MQRLCLVVIDLLNDYLDRWEPQRSAALIEATNLLVSTFRRAGHPVIWVRQEFSSDLSDAFLEMRDRQISICIAGTPGAQFHPNLQRDPGDAILVKKRYSAFFGTDLANRLSEWKITDVVLGGINTHACIRMTAVDAYQYDYRVHIVRECIDSYDAEHSRVSLSYMDGKIARVVRLAEAILLLDD